MRSGWRTRKLKEIATKIGSGSTPRGGESVYKFSGVPLIRSMNVHFAGFKHDGLAYLDQQEAAKLNHVTVQANDVLLNITGASIGRVTTAPESLAGSRVNQHVCIIRPTVDLSPRFLAHYLASPAQQAQVMNVQVGVTRQALTKTMIENWEIPLPALDEQREIVAEIEKQFTRLEAGVAGLRRVQANLKRYRATILKAACEGKLVPTEAELAREEGRSYETGAQLLERCLSKRSEKCGKGKFKETLILHIPRYPELPEGWVAASIETLCKIVDGDRGKEYPRKEDFLADGFCLFLNTKNVRPNGFRFDEKQFISQEKNDRLRQGKLERGDIVVTSRGTIGNVALYDETVFYDCVRINSGMFILREFGDVLDAKYFSWYLRSPAVAHQIENERSGTAQPQLPIRDFRTFIICFPCRPEQKRIVEEIERKLSVVDQLEAVVNANLQRAARLRHSILQQAFEGKLLDTQRGSLAAGNSQEDDAQHRTRLATE